MSTGTIQITEQERLHMEEQIKPLPLVTKEQLREAYYRLAANHQIRPVNQYWRIFHRAATEGIAND